MEKPKQQGKQEHEEVGEGGQPKRRIYERNAEACYLTIQLQI